MCGAGPHHQRLRLDRGIRNILKRKEAEQVASYGIETIMALACLAYLLTTKLIEGPNATDLLHSDQNVHRRAHTCTQLEVKEGPGG